jgi:hypothetical protein
MHWRSIIWKREDIPLNLKNWSPINCFEGVTFLTVRESPINTS